MKKSVLMKRGVEVKDIKSKPYIPLRLFVVLFVATFIVFSVLSFISNNSSKGIVERGEVMNAPGECELTLENSLLTYWPFDENPQMDTGIIQNYVTQRYTSFENPDLSYTANDAVAVNKAISGIRGSAMEFDGHDFARSYILVDNLVEGNVFSMSIWVKPKNLGGNYSIVEFGQLTTRLFSGYYFSIFNNSVCFGNSIRSIYKKAVCSSISPNNWVHLVGVQNGEGITLYINGMAVSSGSGYSLNTTNTNSIVVGGVVLNNNSEFKIGIDEFSFFQKALNSSEVMNIYNSGNGIDLCSERISPVVNGSSGGIEGTNEIIIDNTDGGFSSVGYWPLSNITGYYGSDSVYSKATGANANWTFSIPETTIYNLSAWWTASSSRISKAPYRIYRNNVLIENFTTDQTNIALNSRWNFLGSYSLSKGDKLIVNLVVLNNSKSHNADAMKLVYSNVSSVIPVVNCTDNDEDGYGVGCSSGVDCNDDDEIVYQNVNCIYNGSTCGSYQLCAASCPSLPVEICGNNIDENCDGLNENCTAVPVLEVSYPENTTYVNIGVPLRFSAPGASNCWYVLNNNKTDSSCVEDKKLYLNTGNYLLTIVANNSFGFNQMNRNFSVVKNRTYFISYDEFYSKGQTTDLLVINESNFDKLSSFILDNPNLGKIEFLETVNLTKDANSNNIVDIDSNVNISFNRIEVDSSVLSSMNKKARLTLRGINFTNPRILKNNANCTDCPIEKNENNSIVFNVTGFSIYRVVDTVHQTIVVNKTDNRTDSQKSCSELKGVSCSSTQICTGSLKDSLNGKCCIGYCTEKDNRKRVSLSDTPSFASLTDNEKILLQVSEGDYELVTTIDGEKVSVNIDDKDYVLKLNKISTISIGSDEMYVALKSVSDGEAEIIVGTDKKALQDELGTSSSSNSVMIVLVVVFILAIIGIGVTILFLIQKKDTHMGKRSSGENVSGDSANSIFKIRRNQ